MILVAARDFSAVVKSELKADAVAMNARCLVGVSTVGGRIERSTAIIVADDDFLFDRCLVEEVLQGLGPMNDDTSLTESVFNDESRHREFTDFDRAVMNVLYHPAIRPGMSGTEVHRALPPRPRRSRLRELRAGEAVGFAGVFVSARSSPLALPRFATWQPFRHGSEASLSERHFKGWPGCDLVKGSLRRLRRP